jgi:TorA maturation chaperone TorD
MEAGDLQQGDARTMAEVCAFLAGVLSSPPTEETAGAVARMASALGVACPDDVGAATLEREYADLFVVPNPRYVAPYESVYRDRWEMPAALQTGAGPAGKGGAVKGLLMGESTLKVRRLQLEAGLQPQRDLPDHVANEMWLLAHLWKKEAEAPLADRPEWARRRAQFAAEHLQQWLGDLAAAVRRHQHAGVYGATLDIAQAVVGFDNVAN